MIIQIGRLTLYPTWLPFMASMEVKIRVSEGAMDSVPLAALLVLHYCKHSGRVLLPSEPTRSPTFIIHYRAPVCMKSYPIYSVRSGERRRHG